MTDVVFIGDDITALGFRLAGVECHVPGPGETARIVAEARRRAQVIMMTPDAFEALPARQARELENSETPLLAIVADARGLSPVPDTEREVKRALGIET